MGCSTGATRRGRAPLAPFSPPPTLLADRPGRSAHRVTGAGSSTSTATGWPTSSYLSGNTPGITGVTEDGWDDFQTFEVVPHGRRRRPTAAIGRSRRRRASDLMLTDDDVFTWYPSPGRPASDRPCGGCRPIDETRPTCRLRRRPPNDLPRRHVRRRLERPGPDPQRRGLLLAQPRAWPLRREGHHGPRARVRPRRTVSTCAIRLADIDGSGTTDLVYLGPDGVASTRNQSGNAWSDAAAVPAASARRRPDAVQVVDLLGTGTACLVCFVAAARRWATSRPLRRLMGGQKPHLLAVTKRPRRRDPRSSTRRRPRSTWRTRGRRRG